MSKYGLALQERRELRGYKTQSDLARAVKSLADKGALPPELRPFSQQWLSILEDDRDGEALANARPRMIRALAYMLKMSSEEFENAIGVAIPAVPGYDQPRQSKSAGESGWVAPKEELPIPSELLEAAAQWGDQPEFAGLREYRWQRFLTDLHHKRPPHTAAQWLKVFSDLHERLEPPQVERGSVNS